MATIARISITGVILGTMMLIGIQGIKPILDRVYHGPDRSDCLRIEGCKDGDIVVWTHSGVYTAFVCSGEEWTAFNAEESGGELDENDINPEKF